MAWVRNQTCDRKLSPGCPEAVGTLQTNTLLRYNTVLTPAGRLAALSDSELIKRFVVNKDD